MAITYYNDFVDRVGRKYRLELQAPSTRYSYVEMTMPANPLKLSMDDDNDPFIPSRCTTGYVRVFSDVYTTFVDNPGLTCTVELKRITGTDVNPIYTRYWFGYIQPKAYTVNYWEANYEDTELLVECPLAAFERMDLPIASLPEYCTFGQALKAIIDEQTSISGSEYWNSIIFPSVDVADNVLTATFDLSLFYDYDVDGEKIANVTCLEFIEDFCKFFGLCVRTNGQGTMAFTETWNNRVNKAECWDLDCLISDTPGQMFEEQALYTIDVSGDIFVNTDNSLEYVPGFSRLTVAVDMSKDSTSLFEMPNDRLKDLLKGGTVESHQHTTSNNEDIRDWSIYRESEVGYRFKDWRMTFVTPEADSDDKSWLKKGSRLFLNCNFEYWGATTVDWTPVIQVANSDTGGNSPQFTLASTRKYFLSKGYITINATTYIKRNYVKYTGACYMRCKFQFGRYYWTDDGWSQSEGTFDMSLGAALGHAGTNTENATGVISNTLKHMDARVDYSGGYAVTMNIGTEDLPPVCDNIIFQVCSPMNSIDETVLNEICIEDLKIDWIPYNASKQPYQDLPEDYKSDNGTHFRDKKEISVEFASDKYGLIAPNRLYKADGSMLSTIDYGNDGGVLHPEAWLAKKGAVFGSTAHKYLDIEVDASKTGWCHPCTTFYDGPNVFSGRWFCLSVSPDYYNCTQRLKLIQI